MYPHFEESFGLASTQQRRHGAHLQQGNRPGLYSSLPPKPPIPKQLSCSETIKVTLKVNKQLDMLLGVRFYITLNQSKIS